jgi:hypothetical protein
MDTSGQRVAAAFSWMQERTGSDRAPAYALCSSSPVHNSRVVPLSAGSKPGIAGADSRIFSDVYDRFVSAWLSWRYALSLRGRRL